MAGSRTGDHQLAGLLLAGSGIAFLLTVVYLFTVLTGAGLTLDMFDDAAALVTWSQQNQGRYVGLWILYLVVQLLFLPVPALLARAALQAPPPRPASDDDGGASGGGGGTDRAEEGGGGGSLDLAVRALTPAGTGAALLALAGVVTQLALARVSFNWDLATSADAGTLLDVHALAADLGKYLRLTAELLLGAWMVGLGVATHRAFATRWAVAAAACGLWTVLVATLKLIDPLTGLEDWLAFVIGIAHLGWGLGLLRARVGAPELRSVSHRFGS